MEKNKLIMYPLYFTIKEVECRCGCGFIEMNPEFLIRLTLARHLAGFAFPITSWCRCKAHNKAVGGTENSAHLTGIGADIYVVDPVLKYSTIDALHQAGLYRIGVGEDFIHVDQDRTKRQHSVWLYNIQGRRATWTEKESQKSYLQCWQT